MKMNFGFYQTDERKVTLDNKLKYVQPYTIWVTSIADPYDKPDPRGFEQV